MSSPESAPQGDPSSAISADRYVDAGAVRFLRDGGFLTALIDGREVVVLRVAGQLHAISNRCPHNGMPLQDGCVLDNVITCRWHGWQFDLSTGRPPGSDPDVDGPRIRVYPVRIDDGRVQVGMTPLTGSRSAATDPGEPSR